MEIIEVIFIDDHIQKDLNLQTQLAIVILAFVLRFLLELSLVIF
jgi:hypothetical protein